MGLPILVLGESGSGKSASLRNLKPDEFCLVNVAGKALPFKSKDVDKISGTTDFKRIYTFLKTSKKKTIVVDDAQYIMSFQYMRRIKENGWDKFNELQSDFFNLIDCVKDLPSDVIVYFLSHIQTTEDGRQKIKTIGKMLDEKITIEGMFTVVLKTYTADGKYYFLTQNSGNDTVKSPMGLFPSYAIDNDLKYVDEKIRNYYELGEFLSDDDIAEIDEAAAKVDIIKDEVEGKKRRSARGKSNEAAENNEQSKNAESEKTTRRRRKSEEKEEKGEKEETTTNNNQSEPDDTGTDTAENTSDTANSGRRRGRNAVRTEQAEKTVNEAIMNIPEDADEEVPFDKQDEKPAEEVAPRRRRQRGAEVEPNTGEVMNESEEPTNETPRRRRRRD